jgi:hypothetical protein
MDISIKLSIKDFPTNEDEKEVMANIPYKEVTGSFTWAMINTHPDLAYSVGVISQYMANPGKIHWQAIKRLF